MTEATIDLLHDILVELRALRRDMAVPQCRQLAPNDRAMLAILFPVAAQAVGARAFTTAELYAHAESVDSRLRGALAACGSSRAVGRLLRRATDIGVDGFCVRRVGDEAAGAVWVIEPMETRISHRDT